MFSSAVWLWTRVASRRPRSATPHRPGLEALEDRLLLSGAPTPTAHVEVPGLSGGPATIRGRVFEDHTGNGQWAAGDPGLAGRTVFLDLQDDGKLDPTDPRTVTAADGSFTFLNLAPGAYTVSQVVPAGWAPTSYVAAATVAPTSPTNQLIGLDAFNADPRFASINGQGESVVLLDTGIDAANPAFGPLNSQGAASAIVYQHDFTTGDSQAVDGDGHGTYVASLIASHDPTYPGIAPGVNLIVLKVLDNKGDGQFGDIDQALKWVIANAGNYHIACVNMSFGDGGNYTSMESLYGIGPDLAALANDNIVVVAAAGNGYTGSNAQPGLSYPASDPAVIPVGAVWDDNHGGPWVWDDGTRDNTTAADRIISFSQRQPGSGEVFAPGSLLTGAAPGGGTSQLSGTSTAAAVVSGVVALAQQLARETLGHQLSTTQMRDLLNSTGAAIRDGRYEDDNVAHTGAIFHRVDVHALAEAVIGLGTVSLGPNAGSRVVSVPAGTTANVLLGSFHLGQVSGQVFNDAENTQKPTASAKGLAGQVVFADLNNDGQLDPGDPSAVTDSQGQFILIRLPAGPTTIRVLLLAGEQQTTSLLHLVVDSGLNVKGVALGVHVTVLPPAPVLTGNGRIDGIPEGATNPAGVNVAALLGSTFSDAVPQSKSGIAVVGVSANVQGTWQYSLNGGRTWQNMGAVSLSQARLLAGADQLRFVPAAGFYGTAWISYRGWNQTSGTAGWLVDLGGSRTGGTTAFSGMQATAKVTVTYVHQAPVLTGPGWLSQAKPGAANPPGETVADILAGTIAHLDPLGKTGMALLDAMGQGTWQYSRDGGRTWSNLGTVSSARARLLSGPDLLRFIPVKGWNGKAQLTYRAWDQTTGSAGGVLDLRPADLVGGQTAYSSAVETAVLNQAAVSSGPSVA